MASPRMAHISELATMALHRQSDPHKPNSKIKVHKARIVSFSYRIQTDITFHDVRPRSNRHPLIAGVVLPSEHVLACPYRFGRCLKETRRIPLTASARNHADARNVSSISGCSAMGRSSGVRPDRAINGNVSTRGSLPWRPCSMTPKRINSQRRYDAKATSISISMTHASNKSQQILS
jgi:hypothetical protein